MQSPPTYAFWSADYRADPYPLYRSMLTDAPMHWNGGAWVLSRHADVLAILTDHRVSSVRALLEYLPAEERAVSQTLIDLNSAMMLFADPPRHTRLRGLVAQAFSARMIESMRPRISAIVGDLLSAVAGEREWDLIASVANPLPGVVICEMLGVSLEDQPMIKRWATDYAMWLGLSETNDVIRSRANTSMTEMSQYIRDEIATRRVRPQEDLLTALVQAEESGDRLTEQELVSTVLLLLIAGNETTTNLIGNGMLTLLRHRPAFDQLREDPTIIRTAVEELLRYESPIQYTGRLAIEPIELAGNVIEPGQFATVILGAANRDPDQFSDPDRLDLTRRPNRHVAFAHGIHFCLGAPLARAEGQIAIQALVERFATLELAEKKADWAANPVFRGLRTLRVGV